MLYFNFKNYEEFEKIFGIVKHGNGVESRKNKILLSLYKDKKWFRNHVLNNVAGDYSWEFNRLSDRVRAKIKGNKPSLRERMIRNYYSESFNNVSDKAYLDPLKCTNVASLRGTLFSILTNPRFFVSDSDCYELHLGGRCFYSTQFRTDDNCGVCWDGTTNAIRYYNVEKGRVFKMKAGKMFNHILSCNSILCDAPEQIKRWLSEEFVSAWIAYSSEKVNPDRYKLHVDDRFDKIYDSNCCVGNFHSCMVDNGQYNFYKNSVKAKAAYITDSDDRIVARCIIFLDVEDEEGNTYNLAERQYSSDSDLDLQRYLVNSLIREGYIDGYKRVGASCHDADAFVSNSGQDWSDKTFHISCELEEGGTLSYQDSFKYFDLANQIASNKDFSGACDLATTDSTFGGEDSYWSEYNQEYISDNEAIYVETRDDYFYDTQTVTANVWSDRTNSFYEERCFENDCVYFDNEYYYAGTDACYPEDNGIRKCPRCGDYFVDSEDYYSELTEEYYCCEYCKDKDEEDYKDDNWYYSKYDEDYFEDEDDVVEAFEWSEAKGRFIPTTISVATFNSLVESSSATIFYGERFIDEVLYDGEPVHEDLLDANLVA